MKNLLKTLVILTVIGSTHQSHAQSDPNRLDCMIQPERDVKLGSPLPGVVAEVLVNRGDLVKKGQVVARLQSDVEQAALAVARTRAAQEGEAAIANSSRELAAHELARANELYGQRFVSRTYLDKQRAEAKAASGRSTQARENRRLARQQLRLAKSQLAQRTIRAPFAGVVVERYMEAGEFIDQDPVARIASIDPLRVDVLVPARAFGQIKVGDTGTVYPALASAQARNAVVRTVDRVIDAASNTFRVRLELENPGQELPAGVRCQVDLGLPEAEKRTGNGYLKRTAVSPKARG